MSSAVAGASGMLAPIPGPSGGTGGAGGVPEAGANAVTEWPRLEAEQFGTPTLVADTFDLAESPLWDHCHARLLFSDVNRRTIHTFSLGGEVGVLVSDSNYVNGMIFDPQGNLLLAEMGGGRGGRITRMNRDKQIEVLIDHDPAGNPLRTSDDLVLRSDGTIYFSDPVITHGPFSAGLSTLGTYPFYRLKPAAADGTREIVRGGAAGMPNGIRLSPDEKILYVAGFLDGRVNQYDVAEDGSLSNARAFITGLSKPDSMCLDAAGNVYIGVETGLQIVRPDGSRVGLIRVRSSSGTTNCGFGGPDGKTLFIAAWNVVMQLNGAPIPGLDWQKNRSIPCN